MNSFPSRPRLASRLAIALTAALCGVIPVMARAEQAVRFPGATSVKSVAPPQTVTVNLTSNGTIDAIKVRSQGSDGFDYSDLGGGTCVKGANVNAGQQCTVVVGFKPVAPGDRRGAVVVLDRNGAVLGTQVLDALAVGPVNTFVPGTIHTVAGNQTWIYNGDGGLATQSSIFLPFGVALDAAGDMYIADSSNGRIRRVDAVTQVMTTIAGNGVTGNTGDGGPAVQATLNSPTSVAVDPAGNVFFSDSGNNAVRRISAFDGTISTVAGIPGKHGYAGDSAAATKATLNAPNGISFDALGNLYIADTGNNAVRVVNEVSGIISTFAGSGVAGYLGDGGPATAARLSGPWSVTVSQAGEVYIADQNNHSIRKVDTSGTIRTIAGNGTPDFSGDGALASAAALNVPASVVIDVAGNLYIADSGNNRVRKVNSKTGIISTIAGNAFESITGDDGPADGASLYGPYTLALDGKGSLYIADVFHNRIRKVSSNEATLLYAPIRVNRASAPAFQTIENDGNGPLDVAAVTVVKDAQVDPVGTTCTSATALAPLQTCQISAIFAPTTIGLQVRGAVEAASDAANSSAYLMLVGQVLSIDPATISLTSSVNPALTGSTVAFSIGVTSDGTVPTGIVTLLDGTTVVTSGKLQAGGIVTFNVSTLTQGQHTLTAAYGGDTSNAAGVSPALVQSVHDALISTVTSLTSSANPLDAGANLRLTATVEVLTAGTATLPISGSVVFKDGTKLIGTAPIANGTATLSTTGLSVGQHSITASFPGSITYSPSASRGLSETVALASTKTALSTNANPANAGGPLTLTATVLSTGGLASGAVTFTDGTVLLGTANLDSRGTATLLVPGAFWSVATHTLTAAYPGDINDSPSTSPVLAEVVNLAATTVGVSSSLNPAGLGGVVTFTFAVTGNGGIPTGSVQIFDGSTLIGTASLDKVGTAAFSTGALTLGLHSISAAYSGDSLDSTSTSAPLHQTVQQATIAVALNTSRNPEVFGVPLVLTGTVAGNGSQPTGSVTFTDGTTPLGTVALDAKGNALFTTSTLAIGTHSLVAVYGGDKDHASLSSSAVSQSIVQGTATTLTSPQSKFVAGTSVMWTATVTGANGKPVSGFITILDGAASLKTLNPDASGVATFSSNTLLPGQHSLQAKYAGDTTNAASASALLPNLVEIATTVTTLATSANPAYSGSSLDLTATVTGNGGTPGGTVTFLDGAMVLGTQPLSATGAATFSLATLAPGIHNLSATYAGDPNDSPSASASLAQQIAQKTSIRLVPSVNPSLLADSVSFTVTVGNGVPGAAATGTVTLTDGTAAIATLSLDASGTAVFTVLAPAVGQHTLLASYAGDSQNSPAATQPLLFNVILRPTTNAFSSSVNAISAGQQIVFVSIVQGNGPRTPGGQVTFTSGSTVLGIAPLSATGVATLTVKPGEGRYNVVSTYSGDLLFATSLSAPLGITVGPPVAFTLDMKPASVTMQSGSHGSLEIDVLTAATFVDTLAFGCAGLPANATCTFSRNQIAVSAGLPERLTVTVDTGNPLGAGATAQVTHSTSGGVLACMLPGAAILLLLAGKRRFRKPLGLLAVVFLLAAVSTLSGCGNSFTSQATPAGSYTFQVVGTGNASGATQTAMVQMTVTK